MMKILVALTTASALVPALRATYTVTLDMPSGIASFDCEDDVFILDAAEENGYDLPSSCRSGACTSCQGRVVSGKVLMEDQSTLEDQHIDVGYVCTCLAYPDSDVTIKTHQMDNFENGVMSFDDAAVVAAPAPVVPEPAPVVPEPAPVIAAAPAPVNGVAKDTHLAKKTLDVLRDIVAGDPRLEAKCDEMQALLEGGGGAAGPSEPDYVPFRSDDTGYTIWLNKNDPRNSYYEYH